VASKAAAAQPAEIGTDGACPLDVQAVLERVNAARDLGATCGGQRFAPSGHLRWNERLHDMALMQAQFLSDIEDLRHAGPGGQTIRDRAAAAGYAFTRVGENLALGARSVEHVLRAWTVSQSHCVNLYEPRFTEVALVCVKGKAGRPLWVMVLGRPKGM
jgi:uncharacterized protein YkwD